MGLMLGDLRCGQRVELVAAGRRIDCGTVSVVRDDEFALETPTGRKWFMIAAVLDGLTYFRTTSLRRRH